MRLESNKRRGRGGAVFPLAVVLTLSLLAGTASEGNTASGKRQTLEHLKKQLRNEGMKDPRVRRCHREGGALICRWTASGILAGVTPFDCEGEAKLKPGANHWKRAKCTDPMVALAPQPDPHPIFGYNDNWKNEFLNNQHPNDRIGAVARGAGVTTRQLLFWSFATVPEHLRWQPVDRFYNQLLSEGVRPLWVLYGTACGLHPDCSGDDKPSSPLQPDYYDEFADFAAEVAARYPESLGLELWNEPNDASEWGGPPDGYAYGQLLRAVVPAVKAANPGMPVIAAGLAPHRGSNEAGIDYETFLRQAYETGGPQLADAIGAHPYALTTPRKDYLAKVRAALFRYLRVMTEFGDHAKPIWITEVGYSTEGEDEGFSYPQQAKALTSTYEMLRRVANLPVVLFHRLTDQPGDTGIKEEGYGVMEADGTAKPAYCAIAANRGMPC